jgi:hypothetical protein
MWYGLTFIQWKMHRCPTRQIPTPFAVQKPTQRPPVNDPSPAGGPICAKLYYRPGGKASAKNYKVYAFT